MDASPFPIDLSPNDYTAGDFRSMRRHSTDKTGAQPCWSATFRQWTSSPRPWRTSQATAITAVHAACEPLGGQIATDLDALQTNARHQRTRRGCASICQFEDLAIELGFLELVLGPALEIAPDLSFTEADAVTQFAYREFGLARVTAVFAQQIAIDRETRLAQGTQRVLKSRVAAGVVSRVEIREAVQHRVVADGIVEQMSDAEVESTTAGEYFAPPIRERVRISRGLHMRLRERNTHLHRPTGPHGIEIGEEPPAERHRADEVLEDIAQGSFGPGLPQSLGVTAPVGRARVQCEGNQGARDVITRGALIDFPAHHGRQSGHHRIHLKSRFLLYHGDDCANVVRVGPHFERLERREHVDGPTVTIRNRGRNPGAYLGTGHIGIDGRLARWS